VEDNQREGEEENRYVSVSVIVEKKEEEEDLQRFAL
jgi:hypothetical protein